MTQAPPAPSASVPNGPTAASAPSGPPPAASPLAGATAAPPGFDQMPPRIKLLMLINGKRIAQIVYALTKLNVADQLVDGPRTVGEIAEAVGAHPDALYRALRCAAGVGIFTELPDGRYALTPMAEPLRSDLPDNVRDPILFNGEEFTWRPYGEIVHTLRTGEPGFDATFGKSFFEYIEERPEAAEVFDHAMTRMSAQYAHRLPAQIDLSRFTGVTDVGGGRGYFLAELLHRYPHLTGVLYDRWQVIEKAREHFEARGVADRVTLVTGDFFAAVPDRTDAYVIKSVLHDWTDDDARRILSRIREAIGDDAGGRLFVCEQVVAPANVYDHAKFLDIDMLVKFGGRERDLGEWRALLRSAGFEVVNEPAPGMAVLECRPVSIEEKS